MFNKLVPVAVAFLVVPFLSACPSGPAPSLTIAPPFLLAVAGDGPTHFVATAVGGKGVTWSLSASGGTLSTTTGPAVDYTPPSTVSATTNVQLTAALAGTSLTSTAYIVVQPKPVGVLVVTITTSAGTPSVTVSGPGSFSQVLTATTTLANLVPGSYTVTATPITASGTYVERVLDSVVNASPVNVVGGQPAEVLVSYGNHPGTGRLWVGAFDESNNGGLMGLVPGNELGALQIVDSRLLEIDVDAGTGTALSSTPRFVVLDSQGNLWMGDRTGHRIMKFAAAELESNGPISPVTTIQDVTDGGPLYVVDPRGMAFDHNGSLWVSTLSQQIVKYANPSSLSGVVTPTPDAIISNPTDGGRFLYDPFGLAFDHQGNLWAVNYSFTVPGFWSAVEYANPGQFQGVVTPLPDRMLVDDPTDPIPGTAFAYPATLVFDSNNNMWISNTANSPYNYLSVISPEVWMDGGVDGGLIVVPTAQISVQTSADSGTYTPDCLAFDSSGNLWISSQLGLRLLEVPNPTGITGSVALDAGASFRLNTRGFGQSLGCFAFDPVTPGSPIMQ